MQRGTNHHPQNSSACLLLALVGRLGLALLRRLEVADYNFLHVGDQKILHVGDRRGDATVHPRLVHRRGAPADHQGPAALAPRHAPHAACKSTQTEVV